MEYAVFQLNNNQQVERDTIMTSKKIGGPTTDEGKDRASKNSLKHGATARRFINDQEIELYEVFTEELKAFYKSDNPLVRTQIERIGRIKIQLDRIQDVIDALFKKSRSSLNIYKKTIDELGISINEIKDLPKFIAETSHVDRLINPARLVLLSHLRKLSQSQIKTHEDFIQEFTGFSSYLFDEAVENRKITIAEFIDSELEKVVLESEKSANEVTMLLFLMRDKKLEIDEEKYLIQEMKNIDLSLLKNATVRFTKALEDIAHTKSTLLDFEETKQIVEDSLMPDTAEMDKLMRYQTTLQRQLSTGIGELLILTKKNS